MKVWVCTWEPSHTLDRVERIRQATVAGVIRVITREHPEDPGLTEALREAGVVSIVMREGDAICPECSAFMDEVLSRPGIEDRYDALVDVVQDFGNAVERTRKAKAANRF